MPPSLLLVPVVLRVLIAIKRLPDAVSWHKPCLPHSGIMCCAIACHMVAYVQMFAHEHMQSCLQAVISDGLSWSFLPSQSVMQPFLSAVTCLTCSTWINSSGDLSEDSSARQAGHMLNEAITCCRAGERSAPDQGLLLVGDADQGLAGAGGGANHHLPGAFQWHLLGRLHLWPQ